MYFTLPLSILHIVVYIYIYIYVSPNFPILPTLPFPASTHCVYMFIIYFKFSSVYLSIPKPQLS